MDELQRTIYCVVPRELAALLHEPLREHFRGEASIEVVVEQRRRERRTAARRAGAVAPEDDRRRVRAAAGRRVADRRALTVSAEAPSLPAVAEPHRDRLTFAERLAPTDQQVADAELAALVVRFQRGERPAFDELYLRLFSPLYSYLRVVLKDAHEAEDVAQHVMLNAFQALPRFELRRDTPVRAWLFRIARNQAISRLKRKNGVEPEEPERLERRREAPDAPASRLEWLTDADLMRFVERLPLAQRQALVLRYMLDLSSEEIADVLDRSPGAVRHLEHRALRTLEERLISIGREPLRRDRAPMLVRLRRAPVIRARRFALWPR